MTIIEKIESAPRMTLDELAPEFVRLAETRELHIGILGMGYVGLPLAQAFIRQGYKVTGFDVDETKVATLGRGESYIHHIKSSVIAGMNETGRFNATLDFDRLGEPDAILICVPTPLNAYRDPDLAYVVSSTEVIAQRLRRGQIVILESTTWPGTSEEVMKPILERESGLVAGRDFAIAYSPEREDPGNQKFETADIPKVVGANTQHEIDMGVSVYQHIVPQVVPVKNLATAEAVKLVENIFRLVNIGLVNELKLVFDAMGIDVWDVINGAATKPFGFMPFYPGPGLGGHCIPIDPFYLTWKARGVGMSTRFIELAGEITTMMPRHVVQRTADALSNKVQKAIRGSRILLVGLAYKKNIDDLRESPSLILLNLLRERGAEVDYYDPMIPVAPTLRDHPEIKGMKSVVWTRESLASYDAALIATDHDRMNYRLLCETVPVVVDTRNATSDMIDEFRDKIVKA